MNQERRPSKRNSIKENKKHPYRKRKKMNKKGQAIGWALLVATFLFLLTAFALIPIFKNTLDDARGTASLNCKGTDGFNQTAFDLDSGNSSSFNRLVRRPTCFITGISMVWFMFAFIFSTIGWLVRNWSKKKRRVK